MSACWLSVSIDEDSEDGRMERRGQLRFQRGSTAGDTARRRTGERIAVPKTKMQAGGGRAYLGLKP